MGKPLVSDELWELIQPLLPTGKPLRRRYPGRKPLNDRRVLTGILFVLKSGIPWQMLPLEMGCGSGMSCWRPLRLLLPRTYRIVPVQSVNVRRWVIALPQYRTPDTPRSRSPSGRSRRGSGREADGGGRVAKAGPSAGKSQSR